MTVCEIVFVFFNICEECLFRLLIYGNCIFSHCAGMTETGSKRGDRDERRGRCTIAKGYERFYVLLVARDRVTGALCTFGGVIFAFIRSLVGFFGFRRFSVMLRAFTRVCWRCAEEIGGPGGEIDSSRGSRVVLGVYFAYSGPNRGSRRSIAVKSLPVHQIYRRGRLF